MVSPVIYREKIVHSMYFQLKSLSYRVLSAVGTERINKNNKKSLLLTRLIHSLFSFSSDREHKKLIAENNSHIIYLFLFISIVCKINLK